MRILVIGGAGMIGGHAALHLAGKGHQVSIGGRNSPAPDTPLAGLPFLKGDYIAGDFGGSRLDGFDALVFAAGNDIRHLPEGGDDRHWHSANAIAMPKVFEAARDAGVKTAVNVGSFYPQVAPGLVATHAYVRSRRDGDAAVAAMAGPQFRAMSVNAPFVLGAVPGLVAPMFAAYTQYAQGRFAPMPEFAPPGGTNFISTLSLSEAIEGALARGAGGASYLLGDENLSFQDYFGAFFAAVGRAKPPVQDQEHPMLPDSAIFFGRGNTLYYEPDAAETALLNYRRNDVVRTVKEIVAQCGEG